MKYIGLTIEWDYDNGKVHMHMQGYLGKAMTRFKHEIPTKVQNSPHRHIEVKYGTKKQYVDKEVQSPPYPKKMQNMSRQNPAHSYIMGGQSTPLFFRPSVQSQQSK